MTNQIQGEILFKGISSYVYSPWMPVMGNKASFGIEVLRITGSTPITWGVETRTKESTSVTPLFSDVTVSTVTVSIMDADDLTDLALELVRYRISTGSGGDASKWAVLRALAPSWQRDR